ncbi:hypothetical protein TOK_1640 [Pseudonocardia sp. N23]|nr:hypothetical protein TOK_1640 [Pseudonocardia sp. N23]
MSPTNLLAAQPGMGRQGDTTSAGSAMSRGRRPARRVR